MEAKTFDSMAGETSAEKEQAFLFGYELSLIYLIYTKHTWNLLYSSCF